ncbi:sensor histidine kinase [Paenibacillus koleovorans]|uniref:sensor histidine kinase n=1 Tax=Paenibacillus koleovorans TaxID=121608 RepID=UPI000FD90530|nr:sensor histidine kinase [Paenibacillus koleovorans]
MSMNMRAPFASIQSSLRRKMVIGFIVFVTLPTLFFEIVLFRSWLGTTRDIIVHQYETILEESIDSLRQQVISMERMNDYIYRDYQSDIVFQNKLRAAADNPLSRNDPYLNNVFLQLSNRFTSEINGRFVFTYLTLDGELMYQQSNDRSQVQFSSYLNRYADREWFRQIAANGPINTVLTAHPPLFGTDDGATYFSFGQVIRSPIDLKPLGVSLLSIDAAVFAQLLKSEADNELIKTVVTDAHQQLLFTNHTDKQPTVAESSTIVHQQLAPYGWEVSAYLSSERLSRIYIVPMIQNNGLFIIANFILLAAIIAFLSKQMRPLYILADKMKKARDGHFHVKITKHSTDELGMLSDVFNDMTTEIQRLFERQRIEYQEKLHFQMRSLEAQINPHFIYNMLDLIQCRVFDAKPEEASDLIVSLSVIMRYTTTLPGEKVTCGEELKWMNDYVFLQQQLIGRKVDVTIDFEDRIMGYRVHKLLLQPFIENAFVHGFEEREFPDTAAKQQARLQIRGCVEQEPAQGQEWLIFEVKDTGNGFEQAIDLVLNRDNVDLLKEWGTGLYVGAQRFLLQAEGAAIELRSMPGAGTDVVLKQILCDRDANSV